MNSADAAACLLATTLGEIDLLESEFLLDFGEVSDLGQRDARWWTDLVSRRYPDVLHPAIESEIEALLVGSEGRLLNLLEMTAKRRNDDPQVRLHANRFPLSIISQEARDNADCLDGCEIADSHLHAGGSIPIDVFLCGMATRTEPIEGVKPIAKKRPDMDAVGLTEKANPPNDLDLHFSSSRGQLWDALTLLASCRWALRLLWYVHDGGTLGNNEYLGRRGLDGYLVRRVFDGEFWADVQQLATRPKHDNGALAPINCAFPNDGTCPKLEDLILRWRQKCQLDEDTSNKFLLGLLRVLTALATLASAMPGEGLNRFGDRFRMMSRAQRAALSGRQVATWKTKVMVETISRVAASRQVVGAEFRRSFKSDSCDAFRAEIRHELAVVHAAFTAFAKEERSLELTMPVGFSRYSNPDGNPAAAGLSELKHVLAGTEALKTIAAEEGGEELLGAIFSTDVAGVEIGSSNWPFVVGAEILDDAGIDLCFTIHAGESFVSELNGVRRVGELFMGRRTPERIGHALSLSGTATKAVLDRGRPRLIRAEAIMDLAWLHSATGSNAAYNALARLTSPSDPATEIGPAAWVKAFERLHRLPDVRHLLVVEAGGPPAPRKIEDLKAEAKHSGAVERAIAALAWAAPQEIVGIDVSSELDDAESAVYDAVSKTETADAREHVLGVVRENDVVIESCPTSNVILAGLSGYREHPFWEWADCEKSPDMTISSDDPLHFANNVVGEVEAMLSTDRDPAPVRQAVETGLSTCCGGTARRRPGGWRGYNAIVKLIDDAAVPALAE